MGEDKDPARTAYAKALQALTGRDFGKDAKAWKAWWKKGQDEEEF